MQRKFKVRNDGRPINKEIIKNYYISFIDYSKKQE